ncbi:MAG: metal-sensitive transcriptional regulator [Armatimonadetes bacterium]|nr:metal-sensitive transcriptional regulator [Armatimonadota bacterium]
MNEVTAKALDRRLARAEGQIAGIRSMIKDGRYCVDVLTQLSAAKAALDQIGAELVISHIDSCIIGHTTDSAHDCAQAMSHEDLVDELRTTLTRFIRS